MCRPRKKRGLGRGLEALLGPRPPPSRRRREAQPGDDLRQHCRSSSCSPGKYQPRTTWTTAKLAELAESIKAQGVIQPIVVREMRVGPAARRSTRSSPANAAGAPRKLAGLADVPVVIREVDDRTVIAMALIENIQREDLNPLEEAQSPAAPDRRIRPDPRRGRRGGGPLARRGVEPAAPAGAAAGDPRAARGPRDSRWATPARC